jgi:hypothetical protein
VKNFASEQRLSISCRNAGALDLSPDNVAESRKPRRE